MDKRKANRRSAAREILFSYENSKTGFEPPVLFGVVPDIGSSGISLLCNCGLHTGQIVRIEKGPREGKRARVRWVRRVSRSVSKAGLMYI